MCHQPISCHSNLILLWYLQYKIYRSAYINDGKSDFFLKKRKNHSCWFVTPNFNANLLSQLFLFHNFYLLLTLNHEYTLTFFPFLSFSLSHTVSFPFKKIIPPCLSASWPCARTKPTAIASPHTHPTPSSSRSCVCN